MSKSSPVFKKKAQQDNLMSSRHNNQDKNNKFKHRGIYEMI